MPEIKVVGESEPTLLEEQSHVAIEDFRLAWRSRHASLIGRREVLSGKAKFGIFGDGKEIAQLALAKAFCHGDFRSGYYRDQTMMFALGIATIDQFFAQLYANADPVAEPFSAGRQMNAHFSTPNIDEDGEWRDLTAQYNVASDISPTAAQMPRLVGLAYASVLFRALPELEALGSFSDNGLEVAWGTIGNASCAEGLFWEAINAVGVLRAPMVLSIWDDGYGISVPNEFQVTKGDISELLEGFRRQPDSNEGYDIYRVPGWDYPALVETYARAAEVARRDHVPAIVHVVDMTQPTGHSTSGSHERYKSTERLSWEDTFDPIVKMGQWLVAEGAAKQEELEAIEAEEREYVETIRKAAWAAHTKPIRRERQQVAALLEEMAGQSSHGDELTTLRRKLLQRNVPYRKDIYSTVHQALLLTRQETLPATGRLLAWKADRKEGNATRYASHLLSQSPKSPRQVTAVPPQFGPTSPQINGFEIMNAGFDAILQRDPRVVIFGEDVGQLGDVNQGLAGMQEKYGILRVADTGIREATIVGQAIGLALRGLRPIAEVQYLDYLLYALQIMSDDLATLRWRTHGRQIAPVVVRTRGHRLEGVWHSGSPMGGIVHLLRGMHIVVPRDMVRAVGFYNTLLEGDDPALVVEVLNGYRLKEKLPENLADMRLPLGVPEVIRAGEDLTLVTYGASCRLALTAAQQLATVGISVEVIDVQTLLPFDVAGRINKSLAKTGRIIFLDEDVPGGATAFMMQQVVEKDGGFWHLDAEPRTVTAREHRPAYGSDGNYFSKPSIEEIFDAVYDMMNEVDPARYPVFNK